MPNDVATGRSVEKRYEKLYINYLKMIESELSGLFQNSVEGLLAAQFHNQYLLVKDDDNAEGSVLNDAVTQMMADRPPGDKTTRAALVHQFIALQLSDQMIGKKLGNRLKITDPNFKIVYTLNKEVFVTTT